MPKKTPHYKDPVSLEIDRPLAGLHDNGSVAGIPNEGATVADNVCFDNNCIEKGQGRTQLGNQIVDTSPPGLASCHAGWQYGEVGGRKTMYRVNGIYLYRLRTTTGSPPVESTDPDDWVWVGAISGLEDAIESDIIGSGVNLGTFIQWAHRIHYADGGEIRSMFDPTDEDGPQIGPWGSPFGVLAGANVEGVNDSGSKLNVRRYTFKYTFYDPEVGRESNSSEVSEPADTVVTSPADTSSVALIIPPNDNWEPNWSTLRIYGSPGAIIPGLDPTEWFLEEEIEGVSNFDIWEHLVWLYKGDDELDETRPAPDDNAMIPRGRYVLISPSGNYVVVFGDPDNPNTYYWSKKGNPWAFPPEQQEDVAPDDSDELRGGFCILGHIYLLKRNRGIYMLTETGSNGFSKVRLTDDFGCVSHHSIVVAQGTRAYWLSTKGAVEFLGQSPRIISEQISELYERLATSGAFLDAAGIHNRQAKKPIVTWLVRDPDDGLTHHLVYDYQRGAWTYSLPGDPDVDASGVRDRCAWLGEDGDGTFAVYTGDTTGRCFRLRRSIEAEVNSAGHLVWSGTDIYTANGYDYEWRFSTPWFGDGITSVIPEEVLWEWESCPDLQDEGLVTVNVYRDGEAVPFDSKAYQLPAGVKITQAGRHRCKSGAARRFRIEWVHSVQNGRPKISHYVVGAKPEAVRVA
jgi:hypothetical protein